MNWLKGLRGSEKMVELIVNKFRRLRLFWKILLIFWTIYLGLNIYAIFVQFKDHYLTNTSLSLLWIFVILFAGKNDLFEK